MSLPIIRLHQIGRLAAALALGAIGLAPSAGRAQDEANEPASQSDIPAPEPRALQIALDGSYGAGGASDVDLGGGGALRIGPVFPFKWVSLVPEAGVDVFGFGGTRSATVFGGFAGARLRIGRGLQPGVFAHGGVSGVRWRDDYAAPTMDVGIAVDLTYIPKLLLGFQGMYKSTFSTGGNPALAWYTAGITVGVRL